MSLNHIGRNNNSEYWEKMAGKIPGLSTTDVLPGDQQASLVPELVRICKKITEIIRSNYSSSESLLFLTGMLVKMTKKPTAFLQNFYSEFGTLTRDHVDLGELELKRYLEQVGQESA